MAGTYLFVSLSSLSLRVPLRELGAMISSYMVIRVTGDLGLIRQFYASLLILLAGKSGTEALMGLISHPSRGKRSSAEDSPA